MSRKGYYVSQGRIPVLFGLFCLIISVLSGCIGPARGTAEWHYYQGNRLVNQSQYDEAIKEYTEAIELDPTSAAAYVNRASAYKRMGQFDLAIGDCNKAIELDPNLAVAYANKASAYNGKGQFDLAIDDCNKAIELDPNLAVAYANKASAYNGKGQFDLARGYRPNWWPLLPG